MPRYLDFRVLLLEIFYLLNLRNCKVKLVTKFKNLDTLADSKNFIGLQKRKDRWFIFKLTFINNVLSEIFNFINFKLILLVTSRARNNHILIAMYTEWMPQHPRRYRTNSCRIHVVFTTKMNAIAFTSSEWFCQTTNTSSHNLQTFDLEDVDVYNHSYSLYLDEKDNKLEIFVVTTMRFLAVDENWNSNLRQQNVC